MSYSQSGLTTDQIAYPVTYLNNGAPSDPSATAVSFAFMSDDVTKPGTSDWQAGTWATFTITVGTAYRALTPFVGPTGAVTSLTARSQPYWPWIKLVDGATTIVMQLQPITIT